MEKKRKGDEDKFEFDEETRAIYGDEVTQAMIDANEEAEKSYKKSLDKDEDWQAFEKKKQVFHRTLTYAEKKEKLKICCGKPKPIQNFWRNDTKSTSTMRQTPPSIALSSQKI